jgi:formylglycine-generating enzyme required for sulfatase activity
MGRNVWTALTGQRTGLAALAADDWWSETIIQLAGLIDDPAWLARTVAQVNPWLAWRCLEEGRAVDAETRATIESRSIKLLKSERVADRVRAAQALSRIQSGRVADPLFQAASDSNVEVSEVAVQALLRLGETVKQRAQALAQQADAPWHRAGLNYLSALLGQPVVYVPPGLFLMGSNPALDKFAFENESPQHEVTLAGYFIGRYLVTVAQFRAFVTASSYQLNNQYSLKGKDTNPVVNVTWDDALAYCRWLSERSGLGVTLPTEAEWEKAARGTDGRICPWGNDPPDDTRCNFKSIERATTPVGQYSPRGDSPYGCADMAGNVWEWTRSLYREYPHDPQDGREDLQSRDFRVLRGGAFYNNERYVRCAYRSGNSPYYRYDYIGFRLVVSPL